MLTNAFSHVRSHAAKCYSCLRVFYSRASGPQPPVMSAALTETLTVGGMHDGLVRLWRTDDVFAAALSGPHHQKKAVAGLVACNITFCQEVRFYSVVAHLQTMRSFVCCVILSALQTCWA
jgi:hypothetical protein